MKAILISLFIFAFITQDSTWQKPLMLFQKKQFKQATEAFLSLANEHPEQAAYCYYNAAMLEIQQKNFAQAEKLFAKALQEQLDPKHHPQVYHALGYIAIQKAQTDEAISLWKKTLLLDPSHSFARYNLELLLKRNNQDPPPQSPENQDPPPQYKRKKQTANNDNGDFPMPPQMSLEEVESLLGAMQNQEKLFIQQLKKNQKSPPKFEQSRW